MNPDGPTIKVLNGYLTLPQAPETMARAYVAAALNQPPNADGKPGRPITAPGMGDEALARSRAEEARAEAAMEVERRAEDRFGDIFGGGRRSERNHIDDMLDSFEAESRAQLEREADALVGRGLLTDRSRGQDVASMGVAGTIFRNQIHLAEKSEWDEVRRGETNAYGYYQLTEIALRDIGLMDENNEWTGQWEIKETRQFLDRRDVQQQAMTKYMANMERYLHSGRYDAFDYVGQEIVGIKTQEIAAMGSVGTPITISPVGLMAAAHRWGDGGVRSYIDYQIENDWVSNFEGLDEDTRNKYLAIETRLRVFENVAYND